MVKTLAQKREAAAEAEDFSTLDHWDISKKGNHWREWHEMTLTIFKRGGWFGWCCHDEDGTRFSDRMFKTEKDALEDLGGMIGVGTI